MTEKKLRKGRSESTPQNKYRQSSLVSLANGASVFSVPRLWGYRQILI